MDLDSALPDSLAAESVTNCYCSLTLRTRAVLQPTVRVRRLEMRGHDAKSAYADSGRADVTQQPTQVGLAS